GGFGGFGGKSILTCIAAAAPFFARWGEKAVDGYLDMAQRSSGWLGDGVVDRNWCDGYLAERGGGAIHVESQAAAGIELGDVFSLDRATRCRRKHLHIHVKFSLNVRGGHGKGLPVPPCRHFLRSHHQLEVIPFPALLAAGLEPRPACEGELSTAVSPAQLVLGKLERKGHHVLSRRPRQQSLYLHREFRPAVCVSPSRVD